MEDVHFRRKTHSAADVGRVAISRSLSDIAAMGGEPRFALVSLCVPEWADDRWVKTFFKALISRADSERTILAGGDLSHAAKLACDVMVCGAVPQGKALLRSGARPGDGIYVSGELGGSALGLETGTGRAWKRHVNPMPRVALGRYLRNKIGASAAIDLSDGLSLDLQRLCLASDVSAEIGDLPGFRGARPEHVLHGGEEYELLFTVPENVRVPDEFEGVRLSRIGTIRAGRPGIIEMNGSPVAALGYDHFRS